MKTEKNILIAFILNFAFSIFELVGGIFTGSVAIVSDAVHDIGDAASIGVSYFLEKKSKRPPNERYTYGYARYSALGSVITTLLLLIGSVIVVYNAALRIISPTAIHYNGMILFAVVGVIINLVAALFTREGDSLNQKAVNLHMLEDVMGWIVVLIGAIVMKFTNFTLLDPLMSIAVATFIFINAFKNLKEVAEIFLDKAPTSIPVHEIKEHVLEMDGVLDVHHVHVWSTDGQTVYATMHIVTNADAHAIKEQIKAELKEHGIAHVTLELEGENEHCHERECLVESCAHSAHHHHHHHHH